jgi:hypothetical protein
MAYFVHRKTISLAFQRALIRKIEAAFSQPELILTVLNIGHLCCEWFDHPLNLYSGALIEQASAKSATTSHPAHNAYNARRTAINARYFSRICAAAWR